LRGNASTSRALNRRLILNLLRNRGPISRAELALATGEQALRYHVLLRQGPADEALTRRLQVPRSLSGPYCNSPLLRRARRALEASLREHLRERLPPYMQPAAVVLLERFPVTSNGKVDRAALPAPLFAVGEDEGTLTPTQRRLRALWTPLLGSADIGPGDNFYAQGGDSLTAVRLLDAITAEFSIELEFSEVHQAPTLAGLAERIDLLAAQRALLAGAHAAANPRPGAREVLRL
jgi:acyl carrier protein